MRTMMIIETASMQMMALNRSERFIGDPAFEKAVEEYVCAERLWNERGKWRACP